MLIPKEITVGQTKYTVKQPTTMPYFRRGYVDYTLRTISVAHGPNVPKGATYNPAERAETFWHEITHAVLHDMEHPLRDNEDFVVRFSTRLAKAIRTARF
jgi:hypothetical protein